VQKVAGYLLERRDGLNTVAARKAAHEQCLNVAHQWLKAKGAESEGLQSGSYRAEDGLEGKFLWETAQDGDRSWDLLKLDETASDGTRHVAAVSITCTESGVAVYVTIEAGLSFSTIKPIRIDPRCPHVVRSLLDLPGPWFHGPSRLYKLQRAVGVAEGEKLALQIADQTRTVPILVIADNGGALALQDLDTTLAYDLAGLANIYTIDGEASWGLTDSLGKRHSCFSGGVRVYWPRFSTQDDPFLHPLWTGNRLSAYGDSPAATLELYRRQLRQLFMQASALSVLRPREISDIQVAARTRYLETLMERAKSGADFEQLALAYAQDNDDLRVERDGLKRRNQELEEELDATQARLGNAELLALYREQPERQIAPLSSDDPEAEKGPEPGEVRFYKKTHSTAKYDVMRIVNDCGCNCWQSANKADKARKGIERLEGRNDWKTCQHCGSCTGGGMWRVRW
jgi:hypothetical protein